MRVFFFHKVLVDRDIVALEMVVGRLIDSVEVLNEDSDLLSIWTHYGIIIFLPSIVKIESV